MIKSGKVSAVIIIAVILGLSGTLLPYNKAAMAADNVTKWRCQAHVPPTSSHYQHGLLAVADALKKRTHGRLIIEPYPVGTFVPSKEIFSAVKRGMLEAGFIASATMISQVPLAAVSNGLPFNLRDTLEAAYFLQILGIEQMMKEALAKQGLYYFSDSVNAWELALKKPIRSMEDFKGLKIRSTGIMEKYFGLIGAAPSYLPAPEVYPALATGVVEGAHFGDAQGANNLKFFDVCKYHLTTPLLFGAATVWVINQKAFDKLPGDIQKTINATVTEHFWRHTTANHFYNQETLKKIQKEDGVTLLSLPPAEYKKMQEAAQPVWDDVAKKSPECAKAVEILRDFNKSLGR